MAGLTQNDLKGYIIGTNQFNFQDARVDNLDADDISYDNTDSGLSASSVQRAINEVYALANGIDVPGWELTETYNANAFELTLAVSIAEQ